MFQPRIKRSWSCAAALVLGTLLGGARAQAFGGPAPGAATAQTVRLPDGPGSVRGLADDPAIQPFSGQVTYSVPIELPEALRGFRPPLSLDYSGALGQGALGIGWDIALPAIRVDRRSGVPRYDGHDQLVLLGVPGGGRLVLVPDGTYRVEAQGNDIIVKATKDGGFEVRDAEGKRYRLGSTPASRQASGSRTAAWLVDELQEVGGQLARFSYYHRQGQTYLARLAWGPGDMFEAELVYGPRPDALLSYETSFAVTTDQRLSSIIVRVQGEVLRTYALSYDVQPGLSLSRLTKVEQWGRRGRTTLPALTFDYATREQGAVTEVPDMAGWVLGSDATLADVDGDGAADLLRVSNSGHRYRKNLGGSFGEAVTIGGADGASLTNARLVDVEGRAMPNLVTLASGRWRPYRLSHDGWTSLGAWTGTENLPLSGANSALVDINADGRVDAVESNFQNLFIRYGRETGFGEPVSAPLVAGQVVPGPAHEWQDLNGDGVADVIEVGSHSFGFYLGRGDGTFESRVTADVPWDQELGREQIRFGDLNRDGVLDLVAAIGSSVHWYRGRAPYGFETVPELLAQPANSGTGAVVEIADANGNGSLDVVWSSPRGMWILDMAGSTHAGMLTRADNGMGKSLHVSYKSSAALSRDAAAAGAPWSFELPASIPVAVESVETLSSGGPDRVVQYSLRDGFWDAAEASFGGFLFTLHTRPAGDGVEEAVTETRYHSGLGRQRTLRGRPLTVREFANGRLVRTTNNVWSAASIDGLPSTDALLRKPVLRSTTVQHHEVASGPALTTRTDTTYDGLGRATRVVDQGRTDMSGDEVVTETVYGADDPALARNLVVEKSVFDGAGVLVSRVRTLYGDDRTVLPFGTLGKGWVRRIQAEAGEGDALRWVVLEDRTLDALGNPITLTKDGTTRTIAYEANGLYPVLEQVATGERTLTFRTTWDLTLGKPLSVTDANGVTRLVKYDALGRPVALSLKGKPAHERYVYDWSAPSPVTSTFVFDGPIERLGDDLSAPGWRESRLVLDSSGASRVSAVRLSADEWIVSELRERDARGRTVQVYEPFVWRGLDPRAAEPAPGARRQMLGYDALDRVREQTLANGARKLIEHGAFSQRVRQDGLASVTSTLDGQGRIVRTERTVNGSREWATSKYDAAGRLIALSLQDGAAVQSFTYDKLGRLVFAEDPDGGPRTMGYDDAGRLTEHTNGAGQTVHYEYDGAGRLLRARTDDGFSVRYHYDTAIDPAAYPNTAGRVAWVEEPTGRVELGYDAFGRTQRFRREVDGRSAEHRTTFSPSGLPITEAYDGGFTVDVNYDRAGRAVSVGDLWAADELDASGRVLREHFGNEVAQASQFDVLGLPKALRVTRDDGTDLYDVTITRNDYGAITGVTDADGRGLDHSAAFAYDLGARLTDAQLGRGASARHFTYAFDGLQNMVERTGPADFPGLLGTYRYGSAAGEAGPRQLTHVLRPDGSVAARFAYDGAGRAVSHDARTLTYNGFDQLVRVDDADDGGFGYVEHAYGYDGQRVRTRRADGSRELWFTQDLVEQRGVRHQYVRLDGRVLARIAYSPGEGEGVAGWLRSAAAGIPLLPPLALAVGLLALLMSVLARAPQARLRVRAMAASTLVVGCATPNEQLFEGRWSALSADQRIYFHQGIGAGPVLMTRDDGSVYDERRYEPFGVGIDSYQEQDGGGAAGAVDFAREPHNGLNKPSDPATGWSYHGARWMAPETGRWLTPDPPTKAPDSGYMDDPWSLHPYQYANQNPVLFWDPNGESAKLMLDAYKAYSQAKEIKEKVTQFVDAVQNPTPTNVYWLAMEGVSQVMTISKGAGYISQYAAGLLKAFESIATPMLKGYEAKAVIEAADVGSRATRDTAESLHRLALAIKADEPYSTFATSQKSARAVYEAAYGITKNLNYAIGELDRLDASVRRSRPETDAERIVRLRTMENLDMLRVNGTRARLDRARDEALEAMKITAKMLGPATPRL